jgi:hypothetical protein
LESNPKYDRTARQSMRKITKRALTGMRTGLFAKSPFRREIRNWPIAAARVADGHGSFRGGVKRTPRGWIAQQLLTQRKSRGSVAA